MNNVASHLIIGNLKMEIFHEFGLGHVRIQVWAWTTLIWTSSDKFGSVQKAYTNLGSSSESLDKFGFKFKFGF